MKKNVLMALAAAGLAAGGLLYWLSPGAPVDAAADPAQAEAPTAGSVGANHLPPAGFTTGTEGLPPSLQGTEVDGELEVDAAGRLKITDGVRRVFDYFLAAVGEEPLESILKRIRAYIRHQLPAGAAAEAERLLDNYIAYKRGLESIPQAQATPGNMDIPALRRQMQQVQALRTQYFSPEVITAFFGDEDSYDRYSLDRVEILQDTALTAQQRAQRLTALEQQLPEALREQIRVINQVQNLEVVTRDWQQRGGSPAELRQLRESLVGPEAADRLETLDQENAQWDQRMAGWYAERDAILANKSLSEEDRLRQVEAARASRFNAQEQLRVESLERIRARGETAKR